MSCRMVIEAYGPDKVLVSTTDEVYASQDKALSVYLIQCFRQEPKGMFVQAKLYIAVPHTIFTYITHVPGMDWTVCRTPVFALGHVPTFEGKKGYVPPIRGEHS